MRSTWYIYSCLRHSRHVWDRNIIMAGQQGCRIKRDILLRGQNAETTHSAGGTTSRPHANGQWIECEARPCLQDTDAAQLDRSMLLRRTARPVVDCAVRFKRLSAGVRDGDRRRHTIAFAVKSRFRYNVYAWRTMLSAERRLDREGAAFGDGRSPSHVSVAALSYSWLKYSMTPSV